MRGVMIKVKKRNANVRHNNAIKVFGVTIIMLLTLMLNLATPVYAEFIHDTNKFDTRLKVYTLTDDGIRCIDGGYNAMNGVACEDAEDCYIVENWVKANDYILISTDDKEISDSELEYWLKNVPMPYSNLCDKTNVLLWEQKMGKLYVYKPVYDKILSELEEQGSIGYKTIEELLTSTVAVDYSVWYINSRVGLLVNEFNDRIPSWWRAGLTGFLEITSPVDVDILLEYPSYKTFDEICVRANTPCLLKMKQGGYVIRAINAVGIDYNEETLVYNNHIVITEKHTQDNPYLLDISQTIEKYEIQSADLSDKPDYSWEKRDEFALDISSESVVVPEVPDVSEKKDYTIYIVLIISVVAFIILLVVYKSITHNRKLK